MFMGVCVCQCSLVPKPIPSFSVSHAEKRESLGTRLCQCMYVYTSVSEIPMNFSLLILCYSFCCVDDNDLFMIV